MSPRYICSMSDVFFVQIGGNCGLNVPRCAIGGDPIWEYATQCLGWAGVVLEPGEKFEMLRSFYQARVQQAVTTIRAAASNFSGTASLVVGGASEGAMLMESGRVS